MLLHWMLPLLWFRLLLSRFTNGATSALCHELYETQPRLLAPTQSRHDFADPCPTLSLLDAASSLMNLVLALVFAADTFGNLVALASTGFLVGPKTQLKRMASPTRWGAALVYVCAMASTLICALILPRVTHLPMGLLSIFIIVCLVIQFLAMFWYALSYIPYGRRMFKACCVSALEGE